MDRYGNESAGRNGKISSKRRKTKQTGLYEWINTRVMTYQDRLVEHNTQCSQQSNKIQQKQKKYKIAQSLVWRGFHSGAGWRIFRGELGNCQARSLAGVINWAPTIGIG